MWPFRKDSKRSYDGASRMQRYKDWIASSADARKEHSPITIAELRNRARDLHRNNEYAQQGIMLLTSKLMGDQGLEPTFKLSPFTKISQQVIMNMSDNKLLPESVKNVLRAGGLSKEQRFELAVAELWSIFAKECDFAGDDSYRYVMRVAIDSMITSGECLIRKVVSTDSTVPLKLEKIEADQINDTQDNLKDMFQGIKIDPKTNKPIGIHIYKNHPGGDSFNNDAAILPSDKVIHMMDKVRPGQLRGVSWLAPVMTTVRDLSKAQSNELTRQAVATCFVAFISGSDKTLTPDYEEHTDRPSTGRMESGTIYHTPNGAQVTLSSPPANVGYRDFSDINLHRIAAGLGLSYSSLSGDYSNTNFSAARMAEQVSFRRWSPIRQQILAEGVATRIGEWFLEAIAVMGVPKVPMKIIVPPMIPTVVDPEKEAKTNKLRLDMGDISWSDLIRSSGRDPEVVRKQIIEDQEQFRANNVDLEIYNLSAGADSQATDSDPDKK